MPVEPRPRIRAKLTLEGCRHFPDETVIRRSNIAIRLAVGALKEGTAGDRLPQPRPRVSQPACPQLEARAASHVGEVIGVDQLVSRDQFAAPLIVDGELAGFTNRVGQQGETADNLAPK